MRVRDGASLRPTGLLARQLQIGTKLVRKYALKRMAPPQRPKVDLSAYVADLPPNAQMKVRVPRPIDRRLDQLVGLLVGQVRELRDVDRSDLVAALIQAAPRDAKDLEGKIRRYRDARVHETLGLTRRTGTYRLPPRRHGRRPRHR